MIMNPCKNIINRHNILREILKGKEECKKTQQGMIHPQTGILLLHDVHSSIYYKIRAWITMQGVHYKGLQHTGFTKKFWQSFSTQKLSPLQ